jgi:release factor glutamine methyltransferase
MIQTALLEAQLHRSPTAAGLALTRLESQMLMLHALGRSTSERAWLLAHDQDALSAAQAKSFQALVRRRLAGEPMAYIVRRKEFFGLDLQVDARVLVPRADTEALVDWALDVSAPTPQGLKTTALDLGTGSGAIALALAHSRPDWQVCASDASDAALTVAQANAQRLGLSRIEWRLGAWLAAWPAERFDLIVSNPPYIAQGDAHLPALVHEPIQALTSGADGLDDIRQIAQQALQKLRPGGWLLLEHGHDQAAAVRALLQNLGYAQVQSKPDLAGIARCSGGSFQRQ